MSNAQPAAEPGVQTPAELAALARARSEDRVRGQMMQVALKRLLDQVPGSRRALPHLAALEDGLGRRGACAAEQVPPHWLGRIISQLSSLPLSEEDHELQDLLSRLCRTLARHQVPPARLLTEVFSLDEPPPAAHPAPAASRAPVPAWPAPPFPGPAAPAAPVAARPPAHGAAPPSAAPPIAVDEDGLPAFASVPRTDELDLEPEVFRTFFGDRLRPDSPESTAAPAALPPLDALPTLDVEISLPAAAADSGYSPR